MPASVVLHLALLLAPILQVAVAQFSFPFPFGGHPQFGPHHPLGPNEHHIFSHNLHHPNMHLRGTHKEFEVLHTNEHRTARGADGDRLEMGTQRTIGRHTNYEHDNKYGKNKGRGVWNMFGHEVNYGEKEQLEHYLVPEQPIDDENQYEMTGGHRSLEKSHFPYYYQEPRGKWDEENSYGFPSDLTVKQNPNYYNEPVINYERKISNRNGPYTWSQEPVNNRMHHTRSKTPNIGKLPSNSQPLDHSAIYRPRKIIQKPRFEQTDYKPADNNYNAVHHDDSMDYYPVDYKSTPIRSRKPRRLSYVPKHHQQHHVNHYQSYDDPDYKYPSDDYTLLGDGWEEIDVMDPIVSQYNLINDDVYAPDLSKYNANHYYYQDN